MKPVWVVDDDASMRWVLGKALARAGLKAHVFSSAGEALAALARDVPSVLVTDLRMPGDDGLALMEQFKQRHPGLPIIMMTAYSDLDSTVAAFQHGAFEYLAKPFDLDEAVALIARAARSVPTELGELSAPSADAENGDIMMQSSSPAMQDVFRAIGRLAASHATVLVTGESGTGKELVARALHVHSQRAGGPFVALNAAAIPRDLLEAELFGHERGAFTGAAQQRQGRFEQARHGTLFLDEIGDMPASLQTRLLRVLGEGSFYRVGGATPVRVNVRVIAATHQPLEERVRQGMFREDLYHRLNVIRLRVPALRERVEDIELLARHFLEASARKLGVEPRRLTPAALAVLRRFPYPGNVRQLENICHWITVMAPSQGVDVNDLPPEVQWGNGFTGVNTVNAVSVHQGSQPSVGGQARLPASDAVSASTASASLPAPFASPTTAESDIGHASWVEALRTEARRRLDAGQGNVLQNLTREFEKTLIEAALEASAGRRVDAAARLGLGRNTITRKMRELGME